jgi:hypothetical protein
MLARDKHYSLLRTFMNYWRIKLYSNGTERFEKCKQLLEYLPITFYLETLGGQISNLYLNFVDFFNTGVNYTSVAA